MGVEEVELIYNLFFIIGPRDVSNYYFHLPNFWHTPKRIIFFLFCCLIDQVTYGNFELWLIANWQFEGSKRYFTFDEGL